MNEQDLLEAIQSFIDANDGENWPARARRLVEVARSEGTDGGLSELISWYGGDIDNVG